MNAEALIGTVLGTCTLQKLVGQGGMGAVFLAQQSRPRRQVAVKVLLPMTPLSPHQLAAFLERFRRETDAAASLEHPNIMPVHEYGEAHGQAYLVMPYIAGGTLRDELEREGPLPLPGVANYLEQMAAALDFAHEHGVIHRDIKPANIMVTPEGRLLLTDFGLVKIVTEGQSAQVRLTGAGAPVGTPDYMAPEQVIGEEIDTRADLYSLGIILYQMVTGTTPFHGETPMQIAAQHLQIPPPSAQILRPELPIAAERVIQRALAKRPADRYRTAQELADAFRAALLDAGVQLEPSYTGGKPTGSTAGRLAVPKGQFEPLRQTASLPKVGGSGLLSKSGMMPAIPNTNAAIPAITNNAMPAMDAETPRSGGGLLSRTGKFPMVGTSTATMPTVNPGVPQTGGGLLSRTGKFPAMGTSTGVMPAARAGASPNTTATGSNLLRTQSGQLPSVGIEDPEQIGVMRTTGALATPGGRAGSNTIKLDGPVKVVKVPVTGQPGQYVTGLLSVGPQTPEEQAQAEKSRRPAWMKAAIIGVVLLILFASGGIYLLLQNHGGRHPGQAQSTAKPMGTPNVKATASAQAYATAQANIILSDPLDHNIHSWLTTPPDMYTFKDGAYHIIDKEDNGRATVLPQNSFSGTMGYQLSMEEIAGDDANPTNSFGMIFRFSQDTKNNKQVTTFYSFEVVNTKGGEYQFWKYDSSNTDNPWTQIGKGQPFGNEFHQGQGPQALNTIKVFMNGDKFTITVNGTTLPTTYQDGSLTKGTIGMLVNLKGTEVAFKNLLLTKN